jgi:hypothetical protein
VKGWKDIIERAKVQLYMVDPDIEFIQIKEKWGVLEIYFNSPADKVDECRKIINQFRKESLTTCQHCGTRENVGHIKDRWVMTLCIHCYSHYIRPWLRVNSIFIPSPIPLQFELE